MKKILLALTVMATVVGGVFATEKLSPLASGEMVLIAQFTEQEYTVTVKITKEDGSNGGSKSYKVIATSSSEAEAKAERLAAADCSWGSKFTAISCSPTRKSCW